MCGGRKGWGRGGRKNAFLLRKEGKEKKVRN